MKTNILIVDDNTINLQLMKALIEKEGWSAETAIDGQNALNLFADNDYTLILMDIQMPEMDGYEVTRRIREQSRGNSIPIIAITAYCLEETREMAMDAGFSDYLTKPVDPDGLISVINSYLTK